jgi:putative aldouronate transport system substrate-binding protein
MNLRVIRVKSLAIVLALFMLALAACSNGGNSKENAEAEGTTPAEGATQTSASSPEASGSKEFKMWLGWNTTINNNSMVQTYWKEHEPGIEVKLEATQGDAITALNLKLNTGGFDDAAIFARSDIVNSAVVNSKTALSLEQYFDMPDKYPGLASIPKLYLDAMKAADGHIWSIPTWFDQNPDDPWPGWASLGWFVRTDVLEKVGMTMDDLKTLAGVENYLKAAAKQKDESGKTLLPLSFLSDVNDENVILSTFGVTTTTGVASSASTVGGIPVEKKGDSYELIYDNPQYKAAYQWMNKMYRDGLIDPEAITDKKERYKEKNKTGRIAMNAGGFFNMDASLWEVLDGPTEPAWFYKAISYPQVEGVSKIGTNQLVNPFPQYDVYINKDTKNLDAILGFLDYMLQPKPEQQQIANEGPPGVFWNWVDKPLGKWEYTDKAYQELHDSGDAAKKASTTPELYSESSYSNTWYPWWNYGVTKPAGRLKTIEFTQQVGKMGGSRAVQPYDMVKAKPGGVMEKYLPELENVRKEYKAKLLMAKNDEQFESGWSEFQSALEKRAHWSEMKAEWNASFQEMSKS